MIPLFSRKSITLTVLMSYITQMMMPVAQAMDSTKPPIKTSAPTEFEAELLKKVSVKAPFAKSEADLAFPTLWIDLQQKPDSENFELKIRETELDPKTKKPIPVVNVWGAEWKQVGPLGNLVSLGKNAFVHPWLQDLDLKFSSLDGLNVTCRPHENTRDEFTPYNYIFNCCTNVTLNHLITPGYIDVRQSKSLDTIFVEGQEGVRLKSDGGIDNTNWFGMRKVQQIRSNGSIILQTPKLENRFGTISGRQIWGFFDQTGYQKPKFGDSRALINTYGQIIAEEDLHLSGTTSFNNYKGLMESKSGQVHLSTGGFFKNPQGVVRSYHDLVLHAKGPIENTLHGLIESRSGTGHISTGDLFDNQFDGAVKIRKDLNLTIKGKLDNNWHGFIDSERGKLTLNVDGVIDNSFKGQITSRGLLSLWTHDHIHNNSEGFIESRADKVKLVCHESLTNEGKGQLCGKKGLDLSLTGDVKSNYGKLISEGDITVQANSLDITSGVMDGKNIDVTVLKNIKTGQASRVRTKRSLKFSAETILLRTALASRYVFLNARKGLTIEKDQCVEYLDLDLHNCPFVYKENQLQATKKLSISTHKPVVFETDFKVPGALELTAPSIDIQNKTTLAAGKHITLTGTSKYSPFPVSNKGTLTSNTKGITINGQGFRNYGTTNAAGDFKFDGPNIQIIGKLNVGGNAHLFAPDQTAIEEKKCSLGDRSYINYLSCLNVAGQLHITLHNNQSTFPYDFKTPGSLLLDRAGGYYTFHVFYDLIANKGVTIDMPKTNVNVGCTGVSPVKVKSKGGKVAINALTLDIPCAHILADSGIQLAVKRDQLHIGRSVETTVKMLQDSGWGRGRGLFIFPKSTTSGKAGGLLRAAQGGQLFPA
jgi:adhesin HecA-like repeat protein